MAWTMAVAGVLEAWIGAVRHRWWSLMTALDGKSVNSLSLAESRLTFCVQEAERSFTQRRQTGPEKALR